MRNHPPQFRQVEQQLGELLKSDLAIAVPASNARPQLSSFRSFASRTISVMNVRGGAIDLHKSASASADIHLLRLQRGSAQLSHADGSTTLRAGQFVAFRGAQPLQFQHEEPIELLAFFLRAATLERWLPDWQAAEFVAVSDAQAEGRLSFDIAHDLLEHGAALHDESGAALVGETVARLVARSLALTSLADAAAPADLAEAQRRKVRQFCRKQLGSARLSVDHVARAIGLSRASLHRLFQHQPQTLMQWVQLERLEACRRALAADPERCTLTELALAHGFKSSAHFSTAFRHRYGISPRDYRARGLLR